VCVYACICVCVGVTERKTWTVLYQSFMKAKMCVYLCVFVFVCVTESKTWTALHQSFMGVKMCVCVCVCEREIDWVQDLDGVAPEFHGGQNVCIFVCVSVF